MARSLYTQSASTAGAPLSTLSVHRQKRKQTVISACWGVALVEAVLGYEWLLSALDKFLSPLWTANFVPMMQSASSSDNPNRWWVAFIHQVVLPHPQPWMVLIEIAEVLVALGFFLGALLWTRRDFPDARWTRRLNVCVLLAIFGVVLMTVNYYVMAGNTFPGLHLSNPFDEGLSLDGLLTGIGGGLFIVHMLAYRSQKRSAPILVLASDREHEASE